MPCVCGKGASLEVCCGRFHDGERPATAEELMRSRYAAFAVGRREYLEASHDPETFQGLRDVGPEPRWTRLEVVDCEEGGPGDQEGWVEFRAHYVVGKNPGMVHERSYFRRLKGGWVYTSGVTPKADPVRRSEPAVGRNEPCPCGSGRKYKQCCLGKQP